jgi:hypothetical protein
MTAADPLPVPPAEPGRVVRCEHCHRPLRDPASRALGRGPGCAHQEPARRYDVDQDTLPGL